MSFERAKAALTGTRFEDLRWSASTGSTNSDARDAVAARPSDVASRSDAAAPIVLLTDHQHAGRGRLDRTWEAPAGSSILMTVALPAGDVPVQRRPLATFALALAVTDAVDEVVLKWPNDLVVPVEDDDLGYRKVGGILAEAHVRPAAEPWLLLGIGVNVNWAELPAELSGTATSLNLLRGSEVDRDELVVDLLRAFERRLPQLTSPGERDLLIEDYRERCLTVGARVRVELGRDAPSIHGTATQVRDDGALVVTDDSGRTHVVTAGDVVHVRPA